MTSEGRDTLEIAAEMQATVWKVEVVPGQAIAEGDTLVILESMKMEIPVCAPRDGVVKALRVEEGGAVQVGDVLVVME